MSPAPRHAAAHTAPALAARFSQSSTPPVGLSEHNQPLRAEMRAMSGIVARSHECDVRPYRSAHGLVYQGFPLLTANRQALAYTEPGWMDARHGWSAAQDVFRFALGVGMVPL